MNLRPRKDKNFSKLPVSCTKCDKNNDGAVSFRNIKKNILRRIQTFRENHVYIQTLSVQSIKRGLQSTLAARRKPKKAGYSKLITDEEKRWLDEYAAKASELPSRIGIPYFD